MRRIKGTRRKLTPLEDLITQYEMKIGTRDVLAPLSRFTRQLYKIGTGETHRSIYLIDHSDLAKAP